MKSLNYTDNGGKLFDLQSSLSLSPAVRDGDNVEALPGLLVL